MSSSGTAFDLSRAIVALGLYESPVRHAADSSRFMRFPNEARDYNKEANEGEPPTATRQSQGIVRTVKRTPRITSALFRSLYSGMFYRITSSKNFIRGIFFVQFMHSVFP